MLEPVQNQCLRICLGAFRTSPADSLCAEANVLPLELRRVQLALLYTLKLKTLPANPAFQCVFHPQFEEKFSSRETAIPSFGLRVRVILRDLDLDPDVLSQGGIPGFPPWLYTPPVVDLSLTQYRKNSTSPVVFLQYFLELRERYTNYIAIYTDGSKAEERVASAAIAEDYFFVRRLPNNSSIYSAELTAILLALQYIRRSSHTRFIIFTDALSTLQALQGFNFTNPLLQDVISQILSLPSHKIIKFAWIPSHIGIPGNERVDQLAKAALDLPYNHSLVPYTDFKGFIKRHTHLCWQSQWDHCIHNKLHSIKPVLGEWIPSSRKSRREELVLARLRIGHTHLTHNHLLKGEPPPECTSCLVTLSVHHILIECTVFSNIRRLYFDFNNLKDLFEKADPKKILNFTKHIGLFYKF
jgi:ribonuclease HI